MGRLRPFERPHSCSSEAARSRTSQSVGRRSSPKEGRGRRDRRLFTGRLRVVMLHGSHGRRGCHQPYVYRLRKSCLGGSACRSACSASDINCRPPNRAALTGISTGNAHTAAEQAASTAQAAFQGRPDSAKRRTRTALGHEPASSSQMETHAAVEQRRIHLVWAKGAPRPPPAGSREVEVSGARRYGLPSGR
jgi:hypothetical protein